MDDLAARRRRKLETILATHGKHYTVRLGLFEGKEAVFAGIGANLFPSIAVRAPCRLRAIALLAALNKAAHIFARVIFG